MTHFLGPDTCDLHPPPVRSMEFPYGFPWLRQSLSAQVSLANSFVSKSVQVALACSEAGGFFAFVHPESLGRVPGGDIPGSIWMWPEVLDLIPSCRAVTFAMFQCAFGAPNSKPTRFLGNLPLWVESVPCFPGLPRLDDSGQYVGPLPPRCGHNHKSLLRGLDASGAWRTSLRVFVPFLHPPSWPAPLRGRGVFRLRLEGSRMLSGNPGT